jgi:benzoylformate decarboxylase
MDRAKSSELPLLTGRSAFLQLLASEGVDCLFGNPGTTELAIMEALGAQRALRYVLGLQEGVVVAMADGYARASGRLAAANVHVAPGLGNAMGALYNAKFYGSPLLLTAGQQEQGHGLMEPMLYDPLVPIAQPMVKWSIECTRAEDLPRIIRRAVKVALTPPTGPVFLSLPGDVLDAERALDLGKPSRVDADVRPNDAALERLADRLLAARNPVFIAGHELATREAFDEAAELADLLGAAVWQETIPYAACFPSAHRTFVGWLTRSQPQVRGWLQAHDVLLCLGGDLLRMSVHSAVDALPEGLPVLHISERDWELAKNHPADIALRANIRETLRALLPVVKRRMSAEHQRQAQQRLETLERNNWEAKRRKACEDVAQAASVTPIDPRWLMMTVSDALPAEAVLVEEGLSSTFSLPHFLHLRDSHCYYGLASGGIGFAMAGAIGVSLALPERPVVAMVGDGSAMYSIQALWTAAHLKRPITYLILNNSSYRILKERLVSFRKTDRFVGMDLRDPEIDFVSLAQSFGLPARRITDPAQVAEALRAAVRSGKPSLLDVRVADGFGG